MTIIRARWTRLASVLALLVVGNPVLLPASAAMLGPTPYLSFADSPFSGGGFSYFYLENFEDGALNTPGASASANWAVDNPGPFTDSVDADDGAIDGSGTAGHSFYSTNTATSLTITFNAAALGGSLPTHAGIVWTDVGDVLAAGVPLGIGDVHFSALDSSSISIGSITALSLGNGSAAGNSTGATAEDRFFGVTNAAGIASITISMPGSVDWEVDHLQYGRVPEPTGLVLLSSAAIALVAYGRKRWPARSA